MKKIYKKPSAEMVNVKMLGSVLDDPNPQPGGWSKYTLEGDAKETTFDAFDTEEDIWGGNTIQPKDVWER